MKSLVSDLPYHKCFVLHRKKDEPLGSLFTSGDYCPKINKKIFSMNKSSKEEIEKLSKTTVNRGNDSGTAGTRYIEWQIGLPGLISNFFAQLRGVWQATGTDRSIPRTTQKACVSHCPQEDSTPNSLGVPPLPPKIASSTAPFELQRLGCQILWREWINGLGWYNPSQLRQKAHRCRWWKQCARTCEG